MANPARILKNLNRLAQADIAFYILPLIMLMLIAGTLAQRDLGLFTAQKLFFGSFILWAGPIPLPGFYILTGLLTFSLLLKFLLSSDWSRRKAGIHLTHLGVLVLLIGGLASALTAREGYMLIGEGDATPYVYDYQQRELFIFENDHLLRSIPFQALKGQAFTGSFSINLHSACENCAIRKRENADGSFKSMAAFMKLKTAAPEKEPEQNIAGITFDITGSDNDGTYIAFEGMPKPIEFKAGKNNGLRNYKIIFGRQQRALPFTVRLENFTKENYPGTDKAKNYSSDITVLDSGVEWPARIEMNAPLRYKGYTLYQSSFEESPDGDLTVLSVVENKGRLFPYIGTALIALGLIAHLLVMGERRK